MELKDCVVTRLHQAMDVKKIPHGKRIEALVDVFDKTPYHIDKTMIMHWLLGKKRITEVVMPTLATFLGVNERWLKEGTGTRYVERIGLGSNEVDWTVEQRKLYNFDRSEMRDKALAWVLMHQHPEVVAEFCSAENGHDVRAMRVDIRVNDVELPVKKFEDIISNLAQAMLDYKWRESGLGSVEKSAFVQAESVLRKLHGDTYDKLGEVMTQLDNMKDNLGTLNEMAWSSYSRDALHSQGIFSVVMPPHPEHHFDEVLHGKSSRQKALEMFVIMLNGAHKHLLKEGLDVQHLPEQYKQLDLLARSIYHDLTEAEQAWCDFHIPMSTYKAQP